MPYLSREDIEKIADHVICQYKKAYVPERQMFCMVDSTELAEMLGFKIEYVHITRDDSILGQTSSGRVWTTIYDDNMNQLFFELDGSTILVDRRLLSNPKIAGRKKFTIAHEVAHQIINREHPEMYGAQNRVFCDYRRSVKPKKVEKDWHEWQTDALAAAMLLPLDSEAAHDLGTGQACAVCGYVIVAASGGETTEAVEPTEATEATEGTVPNKQDVHTSESFLWWSILAAVVIVSGSIAAYVIIKKKKN